METPPASVAPVGGHLQAALGEPRPKKAGILTSENTGGGYETKHFMTMLPSGKLT